MRIALAALLLAACASKPRVSDPVPTAAAAPAVTKTQAPAAVIIENKPTAVPVTTKTTTTTAAKQRVWGRVAITTSIVSPSELIGAEVPYSPEFKKLPVFPEKLVFNMSWGMLAVGEATLGVDKIVMFNGRPAYHLVSEAKSNGFCDTFYRVRDLNESWLDAKTLTSLGYAKKVREGHFFRDEWVLYDRDENIFISRRVNKDGSFNIRGGTIPASVQDILSSIFYIRAQALPDGGEVVVDVNTPDNWPLVIKVTEREKIKVSAGRFPAVLVEPAMRREGLFVQKGKRLRLWLSDDAQKRMLMMKVEVFFGHVTASLREML